MKLLEIRMRSIKVKIGLQQRSAHFSLSVERVPCSCRVLSYVFLRLELCPAAPVRASVSCGLAFLEAPPGRAPWQPGWMSKGSILPHRASRFRLTCAVLADTAHKPAVESEAITEGHGDEPSFD